MKNIVIKYWWVLPLLLCFGLLGLMYSFTSTPSISESIVGVLLLLVVILLPVSWIILLINKKWWQCILSFLSSVIIVVLFWVPLVMAAMFGPDDFGSKHKIPDGLEYHLPLQSSSDENVLIDSLDAETYLQVWQGYQGGIYTYDFYYPSLPAGEIFLRCYEVTENIPLSEDRLGRRSSVHVDSTNSFSKLVNQYEFTIYEGDWEDYYAARIEVWFRDATSKKERKLCEKIYRVEGWMR
jgi:hypothetical protein